MKPRLQARKKGRPVRLLMVGHDLRGRGTERSVVRLLESFDRAVIVPMLALVHARGEFLPDVPSDVRIIELSPHSRLTSGALFRLLSLVVREKPDCLLGIHTSASRLVAMAKLVRPSTSVICWEPDPFRRVEGGKGFYLLRRVATAMTHRLADAIISPSDDVADELARELRLRRDRINVLPHPSVDKWVASGRLEPVSEPPFGEGAPVIVNVGNMYAHKAQDVLLSAFAQLRKGRPCRLVVIGEGPQEQRLREFASGLGVSDDVYFYGFVSNPFKYLARADVFVSSATSEGFDISQVEALACGLPVVVTDAPRYRIVENERNGLTVPPNNPAAIAAAVERLLDNPDLAEALAEAGMRDAQALSAEVVTRRYEDLILGSTGAHQQDVAL